ncbi:MAG: DUF4154 domain-containing protein [Myxococcales bacterium]|nr:DUF4154 domain-containing protein [Myxococcales bacterium]
MSFVGISRRRVLSQGAVVCLALCAPRLVWAQSIRVPVDLQVKLLGKVAPYDRHFKARVADRVEILVVRRSGDPLSKRTSGEMVRELGKLDDIGGKPLRVRVHDYEKPAALRSVVADDGIAILYFTPGFHDSVQDIASELDGSDVLSVASVASDVPGMVLGFDLVSSKPKMLLDLQQAKRQNIAFRSKVLKLMKVYR